ncbi:hypothetical protein KAR91_66655 [Candidatus Pacearchaeota archaeon]|nr:hypothetical protein [Candidatus Pacearchaeota archaeon]
MADFGILANKLNVQESIPSILLPAAFLQSESRNVFEQHGEYKALRGRLAAFQDVSGDNIAAPTDVYAITSLNTGTKTVTIDGDHSAGNTELNVGATIRINGGTTEDNNKLLTVTALPDTDKITVSESLSAVGAAKGNVFVGTTPVIRYHRHTKQKTSVEYLLAATRYNIFLWANADKSLTVKFTTGSVAETTHWDILTHLDNVYATDNVNVVQKWDVRDDPANDFEDLGSASGIDIDGAGTFLTACKYLGSFEGYMFLFFTTEGGGANNIHAQRGRWSSLRDDSDFDENSAGDAGKKEFDNTPAFIAGVGKKDNFLYVFTNGERPVTYFGWLTTEATVFIWDEKQIKTGAISPDAIVNDKSGDLYYIASDLSIREIDTPNKLSGPVDKLMRGINTENAQFSQADYIDEFDHMYFAIPSGGSETNNIVLDLTVNDRTWNIHEIPIRAFGDYTRQEVSTYDTLPYDNYDDWGLAWGKYDTDVNILGFPLDLAAGYDGFTYELHSAFNDAGEDYTRTLVIGTDFNALNLFKRVNNGADLYFNREAAGSVGISIKRDTEASWQSVGSASLADTALPETVKVHVPFDTRAGYLKIRLETTDFFELIGIIFNEYELDGYR